MTHGFAPMVYEYRAAVLDTVHCGYLSIVDENSRQIFGVGDTQTMVFYRSASKPVQSLPVFARGLHRKFGLSGAQCAILSASHAGEPFHVQALEDILLKTGLREELYIMNPAQPAYAPANEDRIRQGLPKRKIYHNCFGKHTALLMLQRELGGNPEDYWKIGSAAHNEVEKVMKLFSETSQMELGVDGCGVPVFAVPMQNMACAFKNLACPDRVADDTLAAAAAESTGYMHEYPQMIRGTGYLCSLLNEDPNIVAKGGANGVYGFGLKKQRVGVAFKFSDSTEVAWPFLVYHILQQLDALSELTKHNLETLSPFTFTNDNQVVVGHRELAFPFCI